MELKEAGFQLKAGTDQYRRSTLLSTDAYGKLPESERGALYKDFWGRLVMFNQLWLKPTDLNGHDQSLMRIPGDDALFRNLPP